MTRLPESKEPNSAWPKTITAIDPALRHIAMTRIKWRSALEPELEEMEVFVSPHDLAGTKAAASTGIAWAHRVTNGLQWAKFFNEVDYVVVETQHTLKKLSNPSDVRDLSLVTGAILGSLASTPARTRLHLAETEGSEQWSRMSKKVRHTRLREHWLVEFCESFDQHLEDSGFKRTHRSNFARYREDLYDTIAMSLWAARSFPREGV